MFEKSNEIAKFWSKGKLTAVKLTRKRNEKRKSEYDPEYHVRFRVEVALFDKNTNKQQECLYGSLKMDEIPVFIEALQIFGRKAYQYKLAGQNKMPSTEIFATYGGYENNGQAISTKLWINTAGPEMKADFFITADEAENVEKSARNIQGVKAINTNGLNVFDILNSDKLFITKDAITRIEEVFA